jgi:nucleoside-diphosphate-sugar epimerase
VVCLDNLITGNADDISLERRLLGWEPRVPIDEGLRRTIDDFRRLAARPASQAS